MPIALATFISGLILFPAYLIATVLERNYLLSLDYKEVKICLEQETLKLEKMKAEKANVFSLTYQKALVKRIKKIPNKENIPYFSL